MRRQFFTCLLRTVTERLMSCCTESVVAAADPSDPDQSFFVILWLLSLELYVFVLSSIEWKSAQPNWSNSIFCFALSVNIDNIVWQQYGCPRAITVSCVCKIHDAGNDIWISLGEVADTSMYIQLY